MTSPLFRNAKQVFIHNARPGRGNGITPLPGLSDFLLNSGCQQLYIPHRKLQYIFPQHTRLRTQAYYCTHASFFVRYTVQHCECTCLICRNRYALFYLHRIKSPVLFDDKIYFTFFSRLPCRSCLLFFCHDRGNMIHSTCSLCPCWNTTSISPI